MFKQNSIMLGVLLGAIASLLVAGVSVASVSADINNPRGQVGPFKDTKTVVVNIKGGKDGKDGKDGVDGKDGLNGRDGTNGRNGTDGVAGLNGLNGLNGTNGRDGVDGKNGSNGTDGAPGRDGRNGTDGTNGVDGRDATATILLNVSNGQQIICSVGAGANDIGCVDVSENGTVVIPPIGNDTGNGTGTGGNQTGNGTGTGGTGNQTGNGTGTGNTTGPVQCQPGFHEENGACVEDVVIPPVDNQTGNGTSTGNDTGPVIVDNSTGTVVIDNNTNGTG